MGQKRAFFEIYLYEMGNAMAYVAGVDMLPREMASNIRIIPYFSFSSAVNATFSTVGGIH